MSRDLPSDVGVMGNGTTERAPMSDRHPTGAIRAGNVTATAKPGAEGRELMDKMRDGARTRSQSRRSK